MNEEVEFILDRVHRHEDSRVAYIMRAQRWEKMYRLDAGFNRTLQQAVAEGQEQIVLPTPFNIINLSQRLLSTVPRIDVIPQDPAERDSVTYAEQCEKWLTAMWDEINWSQQRNVLGDAIWQALVRGRFVFEIKWIKDSLPRAQRKTRLPFIIRTLEPMNVGIRRGPLVTEFAYHKSEEPILDVIRMWPELRDASAGSLMRQKLDELAQNRDYTEDLKVCVIDYWETDPTSGTIRNALLVEDEFAKELSDTTYPDIPIVCGRGDYAVGLGDDYDGLSILHPLEGLWEYECRLASQMATALLWHFWPAITVENDENSPVEDIDIAPGMTTPVPRGTRIQMHQIEPNVPLAQTVNTMIEGYVQQSSYPEVMWGSNPTDLQSGYGVSLLGEAAKGRIKNYQESLELALMHVNRIVLALVEAKGGKAGVDIYTVNEQDEEPVRLNLNKDMIRGIRQTKVRINPAIPQDNAARVSMGLQIANAHRISNQTFLDKFLDVQVPTDETRRIAYEELMQSDEMRPYRLRRAAEDWLGPESLDLLYNTPFMEEPPAGFEWVKDERGRVILRQVPTPPPQPPPMEMPMGPGGPTGPDSGMPSMGGASLQAPQTIPGPMGGSSIPPVMQGQIEGETLGLPQDMDPLLFDMMMNTPGSANEQIRMAGGLPPEGTIPGVV